MNRFLFFAPLFCATLALGPAAPAIAANYDPLAVEANFQARPLENFRQRAADVPAVLDQLEVWNAGSNHPLIGCGFHFIPQKSQVRGPAVSVIFWGLKPGR